jgi:hypothetical protein
VATIEGERGGGKRRVRMALGVWEEEERSEPLTTRTSSDHSEGFRPRKKSQADLRPEVGRADPITITTR